MPFSEIIENEARMGEVIVLRELLVLINKFVEEGYIMPVIKKFYEHKGSPIIVEGRVNSIWVLYPGVFGAIYRWENQREEDLVTFVWDLLRGLSRTRVHINGINSFYHTRIIYGIRELISTLQLNTFLSESVQIRDKQDLFVHLLGQYTITEELFDILYTEIV